MKKILSICILVSGMYVKGQEPQKFDINDPRNPDCPCHKYQKLAEEEYKKLLASAEKRNKTVIENGTSLSENGISSADQKTNEEGISSAENKISGSEQITSDKEKNKTAGHLTSKEKTIRPGSPVGISEQKKNSHNNIRHRKRKHIRKHPLWNYVKSWHGWDICKESRVVSACFHWK